MYVYYAYENIRLFSRYRKLNGMALPYRPRDVRILQALALMYNAKSASVQSVATFSPYHRV